VVSALGDGVSAGTVADAAAAEIVVIAVPWDRVPKALEGLRWSGQIVVDATNDFDPRGLEGRTSSEGVADLVGDDVGRTRARRRSARSGRPARALPLRRQPGCEGRGERTLPGRRLLHHRSR